MQFTKNENYYEVLLGNFPRALKYFYFTKILEKLLSYFIEHNNAHDRFVD